MKILSLDTSTPILTMGICDNRKIVFEYERKVERECNRFLFAMMEEMFKKSRVSLTDIDCFAVGVGPGSFTGTRIGVTVIKGLAYTQNKPVIGVSSLDLIAYNLRGDIDGLICPVIDAKRGNLYSAIYCKENGELKRLSDYLLVSLAELCQRLSARVFFLGDAIDLYRKSLLKKMPQAKMAARHFWYPKAANLGIIAYERFIEGEGKIDSVFDLVPVYLYPKECGITVKSKRCNLKT